LDTIELKSELLCNGLSADNITIALAEQQNPNAVWKTGNNGCFIEFDDTQVLVSIKHKYNNDSPYTLSVRDGILKKNGSVVKIDVKTTTYPFWYANKLSTGREFTEVFLLEGDRFFHQAYKGCDYVASGTGCAFCSTGLRGGLESTPSEIGEAVDILGTHVPNAQICLGGGTYIPISENVSYFADCVKEIRKRNSGIPIWIEMVPPTKDDVNLLVELGVTSFGFNLELWSDTKRRAICPGKSCIPISHYLDILEYAAGRLPNRVGSCLLVGLDEEDNIIKGIEALTDIGVHPCLLPFKPFSGSQLEGTSPCQISDLVNLSDYAVESVHTKGLNLLENQGCMRCECCTIMHDIWKRKYLEVSI